MNNKQPNFIIKWQNSPQKMCQVYEEDDFILTVFHRKNQGLAMFIQPPTRKYKDWRAWRFDYHAFVALLEEIKSHFLTEEPNLAQEKYVDDFGKIIRGYVASDNYYDRVFFEISQYQGNTFSSPAIITNEQQEGFFIELYGFDTLHDAYHIDPEKPLNIEELSNYLIDFEAFLSEAKRAEKRIFYID